uniref:Adenosine 3'-phospho 5'-phosphosulfate transporter 1 n=1 Tax=Cyprinus carpio TaxID=7962 RepID=A0A8C2GES7_CYPCA
MCGVCLCSLCWCGALCVVPSVLADADDASLLGGWQDVWLFRLFLNVLGYASIIIPGYFLIGYFKRINYLETGRGLCFPVIKTCVFGNESKTGLLDDASLAARNESESSSSARQAVKLIFCAVGLQMMYFFFKYRFLFLINVLAKASKVIPVMLMGKIVSRKSYEYWEYFTAVLISLGVSMFLLSSSTDKHPSTVTTFSGVVILGGYIVFDSFTSNWQDNLFKYKMSSVQMMFGVNLFSCLLTVGSLLEQGAFFDSLAFMMRHSEFAFHAVLLSVCSACGQLFIFYTISQFGAAVFTIIMTLRQAIAILLSCFLYGHAVTLVGGLGVGVVFLALFLRIYARSRVKKSSKRAPQTPVQKV